MHRRFLGLYTDRAPADALEFVDRQRNCEDILMQLVASNATGTAPVFVKGRYRDKGSFSGISTSVPGGHRAVRHGAHAGSATRADVRAERSLAYAAAVAGAERVPGALRPVLRRRPAPGDFACLRCAAAWLAGVSQLSAGAWELVRMVCGPVAPARPCSLNTSCTTATPPALVALMRAAVCPQGSGADSYGTGAAPKASFATLCCWKAVRMWSSHSCAAGSDSDRK